MHRPEIPTRLNLKPHFFQTLSHKSMQKLRSQLIKTMKNKNVNGDELWFPGKYEHYVKMVTQTCIILLNWILNIS